MTFRERFINIYNSTMLPDDAYIQLVNALQEHDWLEIKSKDGMDTFFTGKQWCERFERELEKMLPHELKGLEDEDATGIRSVVSTAAKRASGIEDEEL